MLVSRNYCLLVTFLMTVGLANSAVGRQVAYTVLPDHRAADEQVLRQAVAEPGSQTVLVSALTALRSKLDDAVWLELAVGTIRDQEPMQSPYFADAVYYLIQTELGYDAALRSRTDPTIRRNLISCCVPPYIASAFFTKEHVALTLGQAVEILRTNDALLQTEVIKPKPRATHPEFDSAIATIATSSNIEQLRLLALDTQPHVATAAIFALTRMIGTEHSEVDGSELLGLALHHAGRMDSLQLLRRQGCIVSESEEPVAGLVFFLVADYLTAQQQEDYLAALSSSEVYSSLAKRAWREPVNAAIFADYFRMKLQQGQLDYVVLSGLTRHANATDLAQMRDIILADAEFSGWRYFADSQPEFLENLVRDWLQLHGPVYRISAKLLGPILDAVENIDSNQSAALYAQIATTMIHIGGAHAEASIAHFTAIARPVARHEQIARLLLEHVYRNIRQVNLEEPVSTENMEALVIDFVPTESNRFDELLERARQSASWHKRLSKSWD